MKRYGSQPLNMVKEAEPENTRKTKSSIWKQFSDFCCEKKYSLGESTTNEELANIMKDWALNMRKSNGEEYKETVIKTMWNVSAKLLQEKYYSEYGRDIDPFTSIVFKSARDARNSKRRLLKTIPGKRKTISVALENVDYQKMIHAWNEDTPEGLQKKFFLIAYAELAWRGGEAAACLVHYFKEEMATGRIEYNPVFTKTPRGYLKRAESKWLIPNHANPDTCPVRLLKNLLGKRTANIKTDRLFLTVNPAWKASSWYKNTPLGRNEIAKWIRSCATSVGLDTNNKKITIHSSRAAAVSDFKADVVQLMKISDHGSSIKPYLQMDPDYRETRISNMDHLTQESSYLDTSSVTDTTAQIGTLEEDQIDEIYYDDLTHDDDINVKQEEEDIFEYEAPPQQEENKKQMTESTALPDTSESSEKSPKQAEDSFNYFGKYIASMLRTLPMQRAVELQGEIVALVVNAHTSLCRESL